MSLVTKVKAANITNLSDARYCAGMGVDWIGFPVAEITPTQFTEITGWLSGPQWVVELGTQPWPDLSAYPTQVWQCEFADFNHALELSGKVMVQLAVNDWPKAEAELRAHAHRIEAVILVEFSDKANAINIIEEIRKRFTVLIDLSATSFALKNILEWPGVGIQLHGSSEERPGLKDYTQLADVLEQLEAE